MFKNFSLLALLFILVSCNSKDKTTENVSYSATVVDHPEIFAKDIISTSNNSEYAIDFTSDGKTAYFTRMAPEEKQKIYSSSFSNGEWSQPILAEFSSDRDDMPFITPDGQRFFFGSERAIPNLPNQGNFDMNIWMMTKSDNGWSTAQPLSKPINDIQLEGEGWPTSSNDLIHTVDNKTFYFSSKRRGDKGIMAYTSEMKEGRFTEPKPITGLFPDEKTWVYATIISPNSQYLVFNSYDAPGGPGGEDIFISKRTGDYWSPCVSIGDKINTTDHESFPRFTKDGKYFFFARAESLPDYEYGPWNIYFIETEYLELDKLFEK